VISPHDEFKSVLALARTDANAGESRNAQDGRLNAILRWAQFCAGVGRKRLLVVRNCDGITDLKRAEIRAHR
jgi:hypothetical protein